MRYFASVPLIILVISKLISSSLRWASAIPVPIDAIISSNGIALRGSVIFSSGMVVTSSFAGGNRVVPHPAVVDPSSGDIGRLACSRRSSRSATICSSRRRAQACRRNRSLLCFPRQRLTSLLLERPSGDPNAHHPTATMAHPVASFISAALGLLLCAVGCGRIALSRSLVEVGLFRGFSRTRELNRPSALFVQHLLLPERFLAPFLGAFVQRLLPILLPAPLHGGRFHRFALLLRRVLGLARLFTHRRLGPFSIALRRRSASASARRTSARTLASARSIALRRRSAASSACRRSSRARGELRLQRALLEQPLVIVVLRRRRSSMRESLVCTLTGYIRLMRSSSGRGSPNPDRRLSSASRRSFSASRASTSGGSVTCSPADQRSAAGCVRACVDRGCGRGASASASSSSRSCQVR